MRPVFQDGSRDPHRCFPSRRTVHVSSHLIAPDPDPGRPPGEAAGRGGHGFDVDPAGENIAQRAYEKWVKRGGGHGSDMQDWVEAEAELRAESGRQGTTTTRH